MSDWPEDLELSGSDPYEDVDLDSLPGWWRRAIEHFRERDIGPYRPPRFEDGTLTHEVTTALESDLGVTVRFQCKNATPADDWAVVVDGRQVGTVGRHRKRDRRTVFETDAESFRRLVRSAVEEG
jgi:hypothetical protein